MKREERKGAIGAVGCILFGAMMMLVPGAQIPERVRLKEASGTVDWVRNTRYALEFHLVGNPLTFGYPKIGREVGVVQSAIDPARRGQVTVLYDAEEPRTPISSDEEIYDVWEIRLDGNPVRTATQVLHGRQFNNAIGVWGGRIMIAMGVMYLLWLWFQKKIL